MSQRVDTQQLMETFKENHRDPRNLAMHLIGFWLIFRAVKRLFTGHILSAAVNLGAGLALLVSGHQLEGSDPMSVFRAAREQRRVGHGQSVRVP